MFYHQELNGNDRAVNDKGRRTSERVNYDALYAPPPEFQSTPLDGQTFANGDKFPDHQSDLFHTHSNNHKDNNFQTTSTNGYFHDTPLNSPDLFGADPFKNEVDLFQAAKGGDLFSPAWDKEVSSAHQSSGVFVDPFKSPSHMEDGVFESPQIMGANPFYPNGQLKENKKDLFTKEDMFGMVAKENLDIFSSSSLNSVDPFPSPLRRDLFQDISSSDDPFGSSSKQNNLFSEVPNGTPDIFQPRLSRTSPKFLQAAPSESFSATPPEFYNGPRDVVLTTPEGTKHEILQPTPFTRARNRAMLPMHSPSDMSHVRNV